MLKFSLINQVPSHFYKPILFRWSETEWTFSTFPVEWVKERLLYLALKIFARRRLLPLLFTRMLLDRPYANLAFHLTTPMEFAITPFPHHDALRVIASTAAEDAATIKTIWRLITSTSVCTFKKKNNSQN